jgi:hypothetical protein
MSNLTEQQLKLLSESIEKLTLVIDRKLQINESNEKKKKPKPKKEHDPNAPKRPLNAYLLFCHDNREKVKSENPELKGKDIVHELGKMWKQTSEKIKNNYNKKALELKNQHETDMKEHNQKKAQ